MDSLITNTLWINIHFFRDKNPRYCFFDADKEPEVVVPLVVVEQKVQQADTAKVCSTTNLAANRNNVDQPVSANAFARGSNMNGAQVMTGHPTTRVLAPAGGGETSIKLG